MNRRAAASLYLLFFFSGGAGLGYQMVWVRLFAAGLGHEVPAMLAVASAFLGGMAAGAWLLGERIRNSEQALRWYGGLELLVGFWAAATGLFIPALNGLALSVSGPAPGEPLRWAVALVVPGLALLPATFAMGATIPAMERTLIPYSERGRAVGAFYAANTLGAVAGTLAGAFFLMPLLGFRASLFVLGSVSLLCGVVALRLRHRFPTVSHGSHPQTRSGHTAPSQVGQPTVGHSASNPHATRALPPALVGEQMSPLRLGLLAFTTGWLGLACQWAGIRLLSQVLENTLYSYAAALAVYLSGTALGAAAYQRWAGHWGFRRTLTWCLGGVSLAWLWGARSAPWLQGAYEKCRDWLGDGLGSVLVAEMLAAGIVLGLPTFCMGLLYSHVVQEAARGPRGIGRTAALNLLGSALAASGVGLWLLPLLGIKACALAISGGYLLLVTAAGRVAKRVDWWALVIPVAFAGLVVAPADLRWVEVPAGGRLREYRESPYGAVAVVETGDGHRNLRVNNRLQMGGTAAALAEKRQAHLPLLWHPHPKRALFLGPGTGITLGAAAEHPGLEIDAVELVPDILAMMPAFAPENEGVFTNARVSLRAGDARRFVRSTAERYDVIVADLFHPAQDGAGFLYTHEHFEAIRRCLNPEGLFCQWLPLHQLGARDLKGIVQTFLKSFPDARAMLLHFNVDIPVLGLVGQERTAWLSATAAERSKVPDLREPLRKVGLERPLQVLGSLTADSVSLTRYASQASLSTDDHPAVLFFAPYYTVRRQARSSDVLLDFLNTVQADQPRLASMLAASGQEPSAAQLQAFLEARDMYLHGLVKEGDGQLAGAIELYLLGAQRSLYFTPAYARCVTIIQVMARADRRSARDLYRRLEAAQPGQPLGKKLLGPLLEESP